MKVLPQAPIFKKQQNINLRKEQRQRKQKQNEIYNNFQKSENVLKKIQNEKKVSATQELNIGNLEQILQTTLKKKKQLQNNLKKLQTPRVSIKNSPFIKYMERKLIDENNSENEEFNINTGDVEQQIKETYILKNFDFDSPEINYDYLNEQIKVTSYNNLQPENYDLAQSFKNLDKANREAQRCNFQLSKQKQNAITIFDDDTQLKDCNFFLAAEIIIMTNIYLYLIFKIGQILPEHIIINQGDFTKHRYINMIMGQDIPDMSMIQEYLSISDGKFLKKLLKDTPQQIVKNKEFFEEYRNFNEFKNILKLLNLVEARKLIVYFTNAIKFYNYIYLHYHKNLHNKDTTEGNYYTKDIPKLIQVNDELSSDEQKIFLQDDKQLQKDVYDYKDELETESGFHIYKDGPIKKILDEYKEQMRNKKIRQEIDLQQSQTPQNVENYGKEKKQKNQKKQEKDDNNGPIRLDILYDEQKEQQRVKDSLSILPGYYGPYVKTNTKNRLSKREKKELRKKKRQEYKAEKKLQNQNQKKEEIVNLENQNIVTQNMPQEKPLIDPTQSQTEVQDGLTEPQQKLQNDQQIQQQQKEDINTAINNTFIQLK